MSKSDSDALVGILTELVAMKTVTADVDACSAAIQTLKNRFEAAKMFVTTLESNGHPSLVATSRNTKHPKLLLAVHLDVVPGPDNLFTLKDDSGKLYGRGVFDMKFALAIYMHMVDQIGDDLAQHDFGILVTCDEEVGGSNGVRYILEQGWGTDVCLLPDGGDNWQLEASAKGAWFVKLRAQGKAAHGSRPWEGNNPINHLLRAIDKLQAHFQNSGPTKNSLTVAMIHGGEAINQGPATAEASLDIRYLQAADRQTIESYVAEACQPDAITYETISQLDPHQTDMDNPFVSQFMSVVEKARNTPMSTTASNGATDARFFAPYKTPVIVFRPDGGGAHGEDEWVSVDGLVTMYNILNKYLEHIRSVS